jgi:hypothetical protein
MSDDESVKEGIFARVNEKAVKLMPLLGRSAFTLYVYLMSRVNMKRADSDVWPSYETIRRDTGLNSYSTISKAIKKLEKYKFLTYKRGSVWASNTYTLSVPDDEEYEELLRYQGKFLTKQEDKVSPALKKAEILEEDPSECNQSYSRIR